MLPFDLGIEFEQESLIFQDKRKTFEKEDNHMGCWERN